jgi:hypothetical protein
MGSFSLVSLPGTPPYCLSKNQGLNILGQFMDLHDVNSATITLHPIVLNLYMFLGLIPAEAKFFTC